VVISAQRRGRKLGLDLLDPYLFPIWVALLISLAAAGFLTIPYAVYSYWRYGAVSPLRTLVLFSFMLYLACAYFLVILPLPDPAQIASTPPPPPELIPFTFAYNFAASSGFALADPATWLPALNSPYVYEPLFNLFLTLPFGFYMSYYFRRSLPVVLLSSLALSGFFETSQITGLFGVYSQPYRVFSVDDLILNTTGGLAGAWLQQSCFAWLPGREQIDARAERLSLRRPVGFSRRLVAFAVDWAAIGAVAGALQLALVLALAGGTAAAEGATLEDDATVAQPTVAAAPEEAGGDSGSDAADTDEARQSPASVWAAFAANALALCLYSMLLPAFCRGATLGKLLVRLRVRCVADGRPAGSKAAAFFQSISPASKRQILARYALRNLALLALLGADTWVSLTNDWQILGVSLQLAIAIAAATDLWFSLRHNKRLLYERLTNTANVSTMWQR